MQSSAESKSDVISKGKQRRGMRTVVTVKEESALDPVLIKKVDNIWRDGVKLSDMKLLELYIPLS